MVMAKQVALVVGMGVKQKGLRANEGMEATKRGFGHPSP